MSRTIFASLALGAGLAFQALAWGQQAVSAGPQQPAGDILEEVIVTAQKRNENLQSVPIALTVLSADQVAQAGITSTTDLGLVTPALTVVNQAGNLLPHIRGVGTTAFGAGFENPIAVYVDGVYLAASDASLLTLNNIAQVEVLKGPQGTLYGRNATGGSIQITTRNPQTTFSGEATVGYGNYQTAVMKAYVTGPIVADTLAADLAVSATHQGKGYGTNIFNGQDVYKTDRDVAVRSKWLWTPSDATTVRFIADYAESAGSQNSTFKEAPGTQPEFVPPVPALRPWDFDGDFQPHDGFKGGGGSLRIDQDVAFAELSSTSAYRRSQEYIAFDADGSPQAIEAIGPLLEDDRQFTQELQLTSIQSGPLQWVAGAFYMHSDAKDDPVHVTFGSPFVYPFVPSPAPPFFLVPPISSSSVSGDERTDSWAVYAQSTLAVTPADHLTLGLRYTADHRHLLASETGTLASGIPGVPDIPIYPLSPNPFVPVAPIDESRTFSKPTWRFAFDHRFSDEVLGYVSYNRGFKSGGFNPGVPTDAPYNSEVLDAYETGVKTDLWDRRMRLNAAAYYYDYKNIQVGHFVQGNIGYYNGAAAKIYGADADLEVLVTRELTLTAGAAWIHDRYSSFPNAIYFTPNPAGGNFSSIESARGNRLPLTPDATFNLSADYRQPLPGGAQLGLNVTYSYSDSYVFAPDNILRQPAFSMVGAAMSWTAPGERFIASLWGKNLTNEGVANAILESAIGSLSAYQPPRSYGINLEMRF
ncbi:MAG TPA: TonB-dependent receptor [Steroidobacteraceae bacterium]|jgi:outer membrane receptor protein involved in Fe transport